MPLTASNTPSQTVTLTPTQTSSLQPAFVDSGTPTDSPTAAIPAPDPESALGAPNDKGWRDPIITQVKVIAITDTAITFQITYYLAIPPVSYPPASNPSYTITIFGSGLPIYDLNIFGSKSTDRYVTGWHTDDVVINYQCLQQVNEEFALHIRTTIDSNAIDNYPVYGYSKDVSITSNWCL